MIILAIDPGPTESAYVIWDGNLLIEHGKAENLDLRAALNDPVRAFNVCPPETVVIEMIASYGMPVGADVFETCVWVGRFMEAAEAFAPTHRLVRLKVKQHLCHDSRAKDSNIRQALIDRFGVVGTKKAPGPLYGVAGDVWAALAVAVTWHDQNIGGKAA